MPEVSLLRDLVVLFAAALPIVLVFQRLNVPTVVGFLVAGVVVLLKAGGAVALIVFAAHVLTPSLRRQIVALHILVMLGSHAQLDQAMTRLGAGAAAEEPPP